VFYEIKETQQSCSIPFLEVISKYSSKVILILLIDLLCAIGFYTVVSFIVSHLSATIGLSKSTALFINTCSMIACALTIPFAGWLTDKIGRRPVMISAALAFACFGYPLFLGFAADGILIPLLCHVSLGIILGFYFAPIPAVLVEIFPASARYTGISIAHNLAMSVFGGTLPVVALFLIQFTGHHAIPAFYLLFAATLSIFGLCLMKTLQEEPLQELPQSS
jgi:MHS family proline/betaine transporter-like MFS transporter